MTTSEMQQLKEEMRQDMLNEARQDIAHENKIRTEWEAALDDMEKEHDIEEAVKTLKLVSKKLNDLGWVTSPQELLDIY